ncbi:TetR/AcrR family transcriptional regulator [Phenylobacterium sp.]|jgi:AcrR family transcriptional regulator|uniref:TetR/AcrR family transcriptional regulator n=1 Tax=Phenylobacterium sp. TaxID=1871053 RepID=UPI002F410FC4
MAKPTAPTDPPPERRSSYPYGAVREAMVEAAVALIQERGPGRVTVREAARRAGVSSGAPFRHFPTRAALMTAAAEEAMRRFRAEIDAAMAGSDSGDPLVRLGALARAYLRWAVRHPTFFEILGDRRLLDLSASKTLERDLAEAQALVVDLLAAASAQGLLRSDDLFNTTLNARTMIYGLARMYVDRQLGDFGIEDAAAEAAMAAAVRHFLRTLAVEPDRHAFEA